MNIDHNAASNATSKRTASTQEQPAKKKIKKIIPINKRGLLFRAFQTQKNNNRSPPTTAACPSPPTESPFSPAASPSPLVVSPSPPAAILSLPAVRPSANTMNFHPCSTAVYPPFSYTISTDSTAPQLSFREALAVMTKKTKIKEVKHLAWMGQDLSKKGRPRKLPTDEEGTCEATLYGGSMYAGVAHSLFTEVVEKKVEINGEEHTNVEIVPFLKDSPSIWALHQHSKQIAAERTKVQRAQLTSKHAFKAKKNKGGYHEWDASVKKIAVNRLFQFVHEDYKRSNTAWCKYLKDAVSCLQVCSDVFKNLTVPTLRSWYNKFYNRAAGTNWDFDKSYSVLEDARHASNQNARLVCKELREGLQEFVMLIVAQKIEINASILRPFLRRFIETEFGGQYASILDPPQTNRPFLISCSWIRTLLRESKLSYRAITNDSGKKNIPCHERINSCYYDSKANNLYLTQR